MTSVKLNCDVLTGLNPAQRDAVLHGDGPLLVLAGAGSGKTRVLTVRIARLVAVAGVPPERILAVTFTNKAAQEMRTRIAGLLGAQPAGMWCGTFHAIGARLLRLHAGKLGRTPSFTIYDEDDTLAALKRVMERLGISPREHQPQPIAAAISSAKNALVAPAEFESLARDPHSRLVARVYRELEVALEQANAVSFDDLLVLPVQLLEREAEILARYRERFRYILVDEYQDTNRAQYRLIALLAGPAGNVAVVGDDDQSIYGWRGADIRNILEFERDFPGARVIRLEENYRSTPDILDVANAAISANLGRKGKTLRTGRPKGEPVRVVAAADDRDEALFVVEDIRQRRQQTNRLRYSDFAVLYRTNAQSRAIEDALRLQGIPYRLVGAVRFYDRREVRDLMAYLKLVANPADQEAFRRAVNVPKRGIGESTLAALADWAQRQGCTLIDATRNEAALGSLRAAQREALRSFASLIARLQLLASDASVETLLREVITATGYEAYLLNEGPGGRDRLENVLELLAGATEAVEEEGGEVGLTPLDNFLQRVTLLTSVDQLDREADAVTLMTLHNAKGLEFPVVYLIGVEEGLLPLARSREAPELLEEERRLFYVGITRAQDALILTHARRRRRNGETLPALPSSFLEAIPENLVMRGATPALNSWWPLEEPWRERRRSRELWEWDIAAHRDSDFSPSERAEPFLAKGARVRHPRFGQGTVLEISGVGRDTKVTVEFDDRAIGRKRLVVAHAGLSRGDEAWP
jgi:DNA helicase-2/ATP-dependent DNA helicase PcrA